MKNACYCGSLWLLVFTILAIGKPFSLPPSPPPPPLHLTILSWCIDLIVVCGGVCGGGGGGGGGGVVEWKVHGTWYWVAIQKWSIFLPPVCVFRSSTTTPPFPSTSTTPLALLIKNYLWVHFICFGWWMVDGGWWMVVQLKPNQIEWTGLEWKMKWNEMKQFQASVNVLGFPGISNGCRQAFLRYYCALLFPRFVSSFVLGGDWRLVIHGDWW